MDGSLPQMCMRPSSEAVVSPVSTAGLRTLTSFSLLRWIRFFRFFPSVRSLSLIPATKPWSSLLVTWPASSQYLWMANLARGPTTRIFAPLAALNLASIKRNF